mmetsp:Transcript_316/g.872  ORF Transcript_316/g.872 Transcript_316/m.872 type:complete len:243 (+) Transcript_316:18-746(+)
MSSLALFTGVAAVIGACVGSFIALCADRIPKGEDVVSARSRCRSCGTALQALDLIPVLSFARTSGTCRTCGATIPPSLLYLEIGAAGLGALAVLAGGSPVHMALSALMLWLLLALAAVDWVALRLPDAFTAALAVVVILRAPDLVTALIGAAIGAGAFLLIRWSYGVLRGREGLGLGDVKLMVGLGAATGPWDMPLLVLIGAGLALLGAVLTGRKGLAKDHPLPFGTALCTSAAILWVAGLV